MRASDMYEVMMRSMSLMRERVRERNGGDGNRATLSETSLGYLRYVIDGGARPLALLNQILPERLGTEQVQASAGDLKLERGKRSTGCSGAKK